MNRVGQMQPGVSINPRARIPPAVGLERVVQRLDRGLHLRAARGGHLPAEDVLLVGLLSTAIGESGPTTRSFRDGDVAGVIVSRAGLGLGHCVDST
jgi:hypothetical protein